MSEEITLSDIRTKIMLVMFCFGDIHIRRDLGLDRCNEALSCIDAYERQCAVWDALDKIQSWRKHNPALVATVDLLQWPAHKIAEKLLSCTTDYSQFADLSTDDVLDHVKSWLGKRRSTEMTDPG